MTHKSVLLHESIDGLDIKAGDIFVDCTLGDGGHSEEVAKQFGETVAIVGVDRDQSSIDRSEPRLRKYSKNIFLTIGNFRNIKAILDKLSMPMVDRILFDLGLSSYQIDNSGRGFTFQKNEPLIMTFEKETNLPVNAQTVVNEWSEETLREIIKGFGEERYARQIAKTVVEVRKKQKIKTTAELVQIIFKATPKSYHYGKIHPATRTFQAIRIAVNDELNALQEGLQNGFECLRGNGRIAVVSFHSLEDRIVKKYFNELKKQNRANVITKKPIIPTELEIKNNPRARSAKLRILEKI